MKKTIIALIVLILIVGAGYGGYWYGQKTGSKSLSQKPSINQQVSGPYPRPIEGYPTIPELNSVSQDSVTFRTYLNQLGQDEIAKIIDGVQKVAGINFDRSYSNNLLNWYRYDDIKYSDWVNMTDKEKIDSQRAISKSIDLYYASRNANSSASNTSYQTIEYIMDAVFAKNSKNYSSDEAIKTTKDIYNYLTNTQGFTDGSYHGEVDINTLTTPRTLIKNNLICEIKFSGPKDGQINEIDLLCGYYDEPQLNK